MVTDELTVDALMRAREILDRNDDPGEDRVLWDVYVMTGRQARTILGMPGRLINKARMEPQRWRGVYVKIEGL